MDMMIYADDERRLQINPCVELNLRRTMGHVALSLGVSEKTAGHIMQVGFDGNKHRLRVYLDCLLNLLLIIKSTIIYIQTT